MYKFAAFFFMTWSLAPVANAALITYAHYKLGEAGSLGANNLPQDSSGNGHHFTGHATGTNFTVGTTGVIPAYNPTSIPKTPSTAYLNDTVAGSGFYVAAVGTGAISTSTDWAVDFWVKTSDLGQTDKDIFAGNAYNAGSLLMSFNNATDSWRTTVAGSVIGSPVLALNDTFTRLTVIRDDNTVAFFVNGVQAGATTTISGVNVNAPNLVSNAFHLGIHPGSQFGGGFVGSVDELSIYQLDSSETIATASAQIFAPVPEPASLALSSLLLLGFGVVRYRRRMSL